MGAQLQAYGRRNLLSVTPSPHLHTDTYPHFHRFKKVIIASTYHKEMLTVLASYASYHFTSQYPSLGFFPVCRSSPKYPHLALPEASYHSPAACGMSIREQKWIFTHVTFGLNSQQPNNATIARRNKILLFYRHREHYGNTSKYASVFQKIKSSPHVKRRDRVSSPYSINRRPSERA